MNSRAKNYHSNHRNHLKIFFRSFLSALSNDYLFTLLPIAIIAIIRISTKTLGEDVWLWPDWSFASIVLIGSSLTRFVNIKSDEPFTDKSGLALGARLLTFILVLSVITLCLAVLSSSGIAIDKEFIKRSQCLVFYIAVFCVIWSHNFSSSSWYDNITNNNVFYKWALKNADTASARLIYLNKITDTCTSLNDNKNLGLVNNLEEEIKFIQLEKKLEIIIGQADMLKKKISEKKYFKLSHIPDEQSISSSITEKEIN